MPCRSQSTHTSNNSKKKATNPTRGLLGRWPNQFVGAHGALSRDTGHLLSLLSLQSLPSVIVNLWFPVLRVGHAYRPSHYSFHSIGVTGLVSLTGNVRVVMPGGHCLLAL